MKTLGIKIVDDSSAAKHICVNVKVFAILEDDDGGIREVDISNVVRAVHPRFVYGEAATAKLEVFLTGLEARCEVEELVATYMPRRKLPLWRRIIDVTTFSSRSGAQEFISR